MTHDELLDLACGATDRDDLAERCAAEVADVLGVSLGGRRYTYAETGAAAGWEVAGNPRGARLAINVEQEPYALVETGSPEAPVYHLELRHYDGLGWAERGREGPNLVNPLGATHPVLR
jgi:hypothetical protein